MRYTRPASFTVRPDDPALQQGATLVAGVPLPAGRVTDPAALTLHDARGRRLPTQAETLARWADGSVKWCLLTTPALPLARRGHTRVTLTAAGHAPPARVHLRVRSDGIHIVTDRLRFRVARHGALLPTLAVRDGRRWRARAGALDLRLAVERGGTCVEYLAGRDAARTLTVETNGPLRAVVCVRGVHRATDGSSFGPYALRIEALAGRAALCLTHSVVFDGDPERDFVRASEIVLHARVGGATHFACGGDAGHTVRFERQRAAWAPDFRLATLTQAAPTHWTVRRQVEPDRPSIRCEEGLRSDGWMELAGAAGRVAVAVRDFWQHYPKALTADAATGLLRVGLYPAHAAPLDLRRYSTRVYPHTYESPCTWTRPAPIPFDPAAGAHGIRKTHDVLILLDEPQPSRAAYRFNHPLRLQWPPAYLAATRVLQPAATRLDSAWLRVTQQYLDLLSEALARGDGAGYTDYFDLPMSYSLPDHRWVYDYGGMGYINDEALPCLGLWQAYLLTGRADAFALARAMTRHNADLDSYYVGRYAGLGTRHNVNHWGDLDKEPRISQPIGKRWLYYLTGDRSVLDLVAVSLARWRSRTHRPWLEGTTAHTPALVSVLLMATETGLADESAWLRRIADALADSVNDAGAMYAGLELDAARRTARARPDSGMMHFMMFSCFGGAQTLAELAERFDHRPLRAALVRMAYAQLRPYRQRRREAQRAGQAAMRPHLNTFRALDLLGYALRVTRDPAFARAVQRAARFLHVRPTARPIPRYDGLQTTYRREPVVVPWPDHPRFERGHAPYHPFPATRGGQLFNMAVYLHKMQALMLCATDRAAGRATSPAARIIASPIHTQENTAHA